jgi:hypothetical protein
MPKAGASVTPEMVFTTPLERTREKRNED